MCIMGAGLSRGLWNTKCVPWDKELIVEDRQRWNLGESKSNSFITLGQSGSLGL